MNRDNNECDPDAKKKSEKRQFLFPMDFKNRKYFVSQASDIKDLEVRSISALYFFQWISLERG